MKMVEKFYSVQGEGPSIGRPAVFIRLAGCDKTCSWCDTKYSWTEGKEESVNHVFYEIEELIKIKGSTDRLTNLIVITGGEPLLQQEELIKLLKLLKTHDYEVEIETNGSTNPEQELLDNIDRLIVSPKPLLRKTIAYILKEFNFPREKLYLKFVITETRDEMVLFNCVDEPYWQNILPNHVYVMPCATTVEEQQKQLPQLISFAKMINFIVSPRLQVLAYGQKRGV